MSPGNEKIRREDCNQYSLKVMKVRSINSKMMQKFMLIVVFVVCLSSKAQRAFVSADEDGMETTTLFDLSSRGKLKFGDPCETTQQCSFLGSVCLNRECVCEPFLEATNHFDKCGKPVSVNESCFFNEQCETSIPQTECRDGRCICRFDKMPILKKDGSIECMAIKQDAPAPPSQINPTMIFILIVMALMFIIICVVLRLFSKARWRENRTIFNTPNPRLMNVSLLRDNKLLHGGERRGSRISVRMPSRQPSMASLRPHSPNASIGSRRGSRNSSSASATSMRSTRSSFAIHHDRGHRASCISDHHANGHVVVSNPSQLMAVNQQQHLQHQQQAQRRRSSIHQSVIQHAQIAPQQQPPVQIQPAQEEEEQQQNVIQDVKVEITEVKP
ncbi:hypothetical protein ACKWTF_012363 [Chironomus riparius]